MEEQLSVGYNGLHRPHDHVDGRHRRRCRMDNMKQAVERLRGTTVQDIEQVENDARSLRLIAVGYY